MDYQQIKMNQQDPNSCERQPNACEAIVPISRDLNNSIIRRAFGRFPKP
jgi:hypothetical protein